MVQRVSVLFVDDLDGGAADGTVAFALDGRRYEIDLSADNERLLRAALEPFIAGARKAGRSKPVQARLRAASGDSAPVASRTDQQQAPPPEQAASEQVAPEQEPEPPANAVPQATFSSSVTHATTKAGPTTRPGSVEIFTHRA